MMSNRLVGFVALLVVAFVLNLASAAEPKSGPQVGEAVPGPLHPLNLTGEHAGEKYCLYCQHGHSPVVAIFARQVTPELTRLIKRIDEATAKNNERMMGSYAVFLTDSEALPAELKELAAKEKIENCVLAIDDPEGPKTYRIAPEAEVTVILYTELTVKANHAFKRGEFNDKAADAIVADLAKILPK
jgi:hypothetical protein